MSSSQLFPASEAEAVAAVIAGSGARTARAVSQQISLRLPVHLLSQVDAMAAHSGRPRSSILAMLIGVGLQEVRKELPNSVLESIGNLEGPAASELMKGASDATEGVEC